MENWRYTKGHFSLCSFAFLVAMGDTATANHFLMQSYNASFQTGGHFCGSYGQSKTRVLCVVAG